MDEIDKSYARMIRKLDEIELDDLRHGRESPCMFKPDECSAMGTLGCELCGNRYDAKP